MFGYKSSEYNGRTEYIFMRNDIINWMSNNYIKFNALYFNNILPPVNDKKRIIFEAVSTKKIKALGIAYPTKPYKIKMNFRYDLPEIEWKNVLLHEMIHIWQFVMEYKDAHGSTFKRKAKTINKDGWKIRTYYKNILDELKDVK